jgi:hypothetical protein
MQDILTASPQNRHGAVSGQLRQNYLKENLTAEENLLQKIKRHACRFHRQGRFTGLRRHLCREREERSKNYDSHDYHDCDERNFHEKRLRIQNSTVVAKKKKKKKKRKR